MDSTPSDHIDQEEALLGKHQAPREPPLRFASTWAKLIILQLFLIVIYTTAFYIVCQSMQRVPHHETSLYCSLTLIPNHPETYQAGVGIWLKCEPTAPAASAIKYQIQTFSRELNTSSIYTAAPSPEVDAAWEKLYKSSSTSQKHFTVVSQI